MQTTIYMSNDIPVNECTIKHKVVGMYEQDELEVTLKSIKIDVPELIDIAKEKLSIEA